MGLLSFFQRNASRDAPSGAARPARARKGATPRPAVDPAIAADAVREARTRARRRLMGATVLLLAGIIGFPLLFETRPRPIPVDLPIEIPARNPAAPLEAAAPSPPPTNRVVAVANDVAAARDAAARSAAAGPAQDPAAPSPAPILTESATPPRTEPASTPSPRATASRAAATAASAVRATAASASTRSVAASVPARPAPASAGTTAVAAVDRTAATSDAAADGGHYVVQIGAFAEQAKAHEARMKVEKMGLRTYVQVVETSSGKRIRVRVGPYPTKAEADKAAARVKGDGLPAAVLAL